MYRPWNPRKEEIEIWLRTKEQKDNKNLNIHCANISTNMCLVNCMKYFSANFASVIGVVIEVEGKPSYKSDKTTRVESCGDHTVATSQ
jgi:hypothetical protein